MKIDKNDKCPCAEIEKICGSIALNVKIACSFCRGASYHRRLYCESEECQAKEYYLNEWCEIRSHLEDRNGST